MSVGLATPSGEVTRQAFDIDADRVSVWYAGRSGPPVHALQNVNLHVDPSEFTCLIGPSGCGKTTLLNVFAGFMKPTEGDVRIGGEPVSSHGFEKGIVFQEYALFPWRTALKNVEFGLEMKEVPADERRERAMRFLRLVGLDQFAGIYPHQLSGGMKQRVAIARALAYEPKVLLMDEPFGALDSFTREELQRLLVDVWQETKKTVIYVTHNVAEAVYLADRIVVFSSHPGRIKTIIRVDLPRPRDAVTAEFVEVQRAVMSAISRQPVSS